MINEQMLNGRGHYCSLAPSLFPSSSCSSIPPSWILLLADRSSGLNLACCGVNVRYNGLRAGSAGEAHALAIHAASGQTRHRGEPAFANYYPLSWRTSNLSLSLPPVPSLFAGIYSFLCVSVSLSALFLAPCFFI